MTRFRLILSEALKSIGANLSTTFASAVSVLIGMFLIGAFIGLGTWLVSWSDDKKRELAVHVYFCSPASENPSCAGEAAPHQINEVRSFLESEHVRGLIFGDTFELIDDHRTPSRRPRETARTS